MNVLNSRISCFSLRFIALVGLSTYSMAVTSSPLSTPNSPTIELLEQIPQENSPKIEAAPEESEESAREIVEVVTSNGTSSSFFEIEQQALANACLLDEDHYVAEFLYQNEDTCYWDVDSTNNTISKVDNPIPPIDSIILPPPTGNDDTAVIEQIINSNPGAAVVGNGIYKINNLKITVPIDIYNLPVKVARGATEIFFIESPNVRIFNSPIDANNESSVYTGFHVKSGSHNFTLVKSGVSNIKHTQGKNAAGVTIRHANNFHLACNTFENITNSTSDKNATARANAIWMTGGHSGTTSGGTIVNNIANNLQSNGARKDSEFFTIQGYKSTDSKNPVKIFANRGFEGGKRMTKHQEGNALVLSNSYTWEEKSGPLGDRLLLAMVNVQFAHNVTARNNRFRVAADGRFDYIFNLNAQERTFVPDNVHFDCNSIEIADVTDINGGSISQIITARNADLTASDTGHEATNSTANYNHVFGQGATSFHYFFGEGYPNDGGRFETTGNIFEIPANRRIYK